MAHSKKKRNNQRWVAGIRTVQPSSGRIVHQKCIHHRQDSGLQKGLAQGSGFGHANVDLFHQPRRWGPQSQAPGRTGQSQIPAGKTSRARTSNQAQSRLAALVTRSQKKKAATEVAAPNHRDRNRSNLCRTAPGAAWDRFSRSRCGRSTLPVR